MRALSLLCLVTMLTVSTAFADDGASVVDENKRLAIEAYQRQDWAQADKYIAEASKTSPKDDFLYNIHGEVLHYLGDDKAALAMFDKAIELKPSVAMYYLARGLCKKELKDNPGAIIDFKKATELDPALSTAIKSFMELNAPDPEH